MLKIDGGIPADLDKAGERAKWLESVGYDGLACPETANDPFLPLVLAAEHTSKIQLMTSIAVAFARNPMLLANLGHDLNAYSKGRFVLGIGSQIRPHIQKRFSMPWSEPAARMKELIQAVHAIWDNWYDGTPLKFRGDFYNHTLMTPMFTPTNTEYGRPKIILAAVGPLMTKAAAEVADGIFIHAFTTPRYINEVTIPAVTEALTRAGRKREEIELVYPAFAVTGDTEESFARTKVAVQRQIAFYGSTPAYQGVLELHGWGDLHPELNRLSKEGKWEEMGTLIDDDILSAFAVVGEPSDVVRQIKSRFDGVVDRVMLGFPDMPAEQVSGLLSELRAA